MSHSAFPSRIDVRQIAPPDRHRLIFATFDALDAGQAIELTNDHDPAPLFAQFQAKRSGGFDWAYLEEGPELWRVAITRKVPAHAQDRCCGSCGGA